MSNCPRSLDAGDAFVPLRHTVPVTVPRPHHGGCLTGCSSYHHEEEEEEDAFFAVLGAATGAVRPRGRAFLPLNITGTISTPSCARAPTYSGGQENRGAGRERKRRGACVCVRARGGGRLVSSLKRARWALDPHTIYTMCILPARTRVLESTRACAQKIRSKNAHAHVHVHVHAHAHAHAHTHAHVHAHVHVHVHVHATLLM